MAVVKFIPLKEVAKMLPVTVTVKTLLEWHKDNMGPPIVKYGGRYFSPSNALQEYLKNLTDKAA